MAVFVIADLHLATANPQKSMECFGKRWTNYIQKIADRWNSVVSDADTVIIPGDISWGLATEDAKADLIWLNSLPGKKIILKGNHDFWWSTLSKLNTFFENNDIHTINVLNNNAIEVENYIVAGSRGWFTDRSMQNAEENVDYDKIVNREAVRLNLSLSCAKALNETGGKEIIVFLHFPPVWGEFVCQPIIDMLKAYDIKRCYFGHIHGNYLNSDAFEYENIKFHLISSDFLDFTPKIV